MLCRDHELIELMIRDVVITPWLVPATRVAVGCVQLLLRRRHGRELGQYIRRRPDLIKKTNKINLVSTSGTAVSLVSTWRVVVCICMGLNICIC